MKQTILMDGKIIMTQARSLTGNQTLFLIMDMNIIKDKGMQTGIQFKIFTGFPVFLVFPSFPTFS